MNMQQKDEAIRLWEYCNQFITKNEITCPETIYQSDRVIENAYELIEGMCRILGYHKYPDE